MLVKRSLIIVLVLMLVGASTGFAATPSVPVSAQGIIPLLYTGGKGGNVTCQMVGTYVYSSERFDGGDQYGGTVGPITWTTDATGKYVSWSGVHGGLAVIAKGGNASNVYLYDASYTWDSGLASPLNNGGQFPGLSNITFCWNPPQRVCQWIGETAWAAGTRYSDQGNWATYTQYDGVAKTVTLYAGQTKNAGSITFSAPVDGFVTITISLNSGWQFKNVDENIKIQDYSSAPSGNPFPGGFDHKGTATSSPFSITVPANNFYGVHVDVEWEKCD